MNKDNKKFVTESLFIDEALKRHLSLEEFLLLLYFDNSYDQAFDIEVISKVLRMSTDQVIDAYSKLMKKKIITIKAENNDYGKITEKVLIDNFYKDMDLNNRNELKDNAKNDIYYVFENELGRSLSQTDYELINSWFTKGCSEDLIIEALEEAVSYGNNSLRYIDRILNEWIKKGIKTSKELKERLNIKTSNYNFDASLMSVDWLNER